MTDTTTREPPTPDSEQVRALAMDMKNLQKRLTYIRKRHDSLELQQAAVNLTIARMFIRKHGHENWLDT